MKIHCEKKTGDLKYKFYLAIGKIFKRLNKLKPLIICMLKQNFYRWLLTEIQIYVGCYFYHSAFSSYCCKTVQRMHRKENRCPRL